MPVFKLSDLRTKVLSVLDNNSALYTNPEIDYVVNEAIRITALFTGFYRATVQVPGYSVADQLVYAVPSEILAPSIVLFEGRQLSKLSLAKLARLRRTWATDTTTTRGRVNYWAPIGNRVFVISPKDSRGGRDLAVTGMAEPPLLVADNDVMALENEYVRIVTAYAAHRLPLKIGGKIFADGSLWLNDFYKVMKERSILEGMKFPRYRLIGPQPAPAPVVLPDATAVAS